MYAKESDQVTFRKATYADLDLLKYWDTQPHVIACDPDEDWDWDNELQHDPRWRDQLVAMVDDEPIGFVQIIDPYREETQYWGKVEDNVRAIDIWIGEAKNLNKGYGTVMMHKAIRHCFTSDNVSHILIDPLKTNKAAQRFYQRLGFTFVEDRWFGDTCCSVYKLSRANAREILDSNKLV